MLLLLFLLFSSIRLVFFLFWSTWMLLMPLWCWCLLCETNGFNTIDLYFIGMVIKIGAEVYIKFLCTHYKSGLRLIIFVRVFGFLSFLFYAVLWVIPYFTFAFHVCLKVVVKYINHKNSGALFAFFGYILERTTNNERSCVLFWL